MIAFYPHSIENWAGVFVFDHNTNSMHMRFNDLDELNSFVQETHANSVTIKQHLVYISGEIVGHLEHYQDE